MRRGPAPVLLDFVAPPRRAPLAGLALCLAGVTAAGGLGLAFERTLAERARLEAAVGAIAPPRRAAPPTAEALRRAADAAAVERELAIPWTQLLAELEAASHDTASTVSLLAIQPDPGKQVVRITAEVRSVNDALSYLRRLQRSAVLRNPMLESHERRKDDPEHPLRIRLSAEWRT
jgi:hypothetical protein